MIAQLTIDLDERVCKCSSGKSRGRHEANQSRRADLELASLPPENRELDLEKNQKNEGYTVILKIN